MYCTLLQANVQAAGAIQKLEAIEEALHFFRVWIVKDQQRNLFVRALQTSQSLTNGGRH